MRCTASPVLRRPPLDVRECRVMVAIRIYDSAARNLMRPHQPAATALTAVGRITDSAHFGERPPLLKRLIEQGFSRKRTLQRSIPMCVRRLSQNPESSASCRANQSAECTSSAATSSSWRSTASGICTWVPSACSSTHNDSFWDRPAPSVPHARGPRRLLTAARPYRRPGRATTAG